MLFASLSFSSFLLNGEPQPPPPALTSDLRSPTLPTALPTTIQWGFPSSSVGKASACNAGAPGSIPGSGRSPREGNGSPLQILACTVPWREEPGGLQSMGSQRVRHDWASELNFPDFTPVFSNSFFFIAAYSCFVKVMFSQKLLACFVFNAPLLFELLPFHPQISDEEWEIWSR